MLAVCIAWSKCGSRTIPLAWSLPSVPLGQIGHSKQPLGPGACRLYRLVRLGTRTTPLAWSLPSVPLGQIGHSNNPFGLKPAVCIAWSDCGNRRTPLVWNLPSVPLGQIGNRTTCPLGQAAAIECCFWLTRPLVTLGLLLNCEMKRVLMNRETLATRRRSY